MSDLTHELYINKPLILDRGRSRARCRSDIQAHFPVFTVHSIPKMCCIQQICPFEKFPYTKVSESPSNSPYVDSQAIDTSYKYKI